MNRKMKEICHIWGASDRHELFTYAVESYFNGQLKQARKIVSDIRSVSGMTDYLEEFTENLQEWFGSDTAEIIINSIVKNQN